MRTYDKLRLRDLIREVNKDEAASERKILKRDEKIKELLKQNQKMEKQITTLCNFLKIDIFRTNRRGYSNKL